MELVKKLLDAPGIQDKFNEIVNDRNNNVSLGTILSPVPDGYVLANASGLASVPTGTPLTQLLDDVFGTAAGSILIRATTGWNALAAGTSGQLLQTGGPGASPSWTAAGVGLISVADGLLISNITGSAAVPVGNSLSSIIDHVLGGVQGDILIRGNSVWTVLAPGVAGTILTSGGAGANPTWSSAGVGLTPIADSTLLSNVSGSTALPSANSLSSVIDHDISSTRGTLLFRGAATWSPLAPGAAGQLLQTNGAGSDPTWVTPAAASNFLGSFTVAGLPAAPSVGATAYANNGRKLGEGIATGTGCPVYFSGSGLGWRVMSTDAAVLA